MQAKTKIPKGIKTYQRLASEKCSLLVIATLAFSDEQKKEEDRKNRANIGSKTHSIFPGARFLEVLQKKITFNTFR